MSNWPFRYQIIFLSSIPAFFIWIALTLNTVYTSLENLTSAYHQQGQMLANLIAPSCEFAIFSGDMRSLHQQLQNSVAHPNIQLIEVYNNSLHLLERVGEVTTPLLSGDEPKLTFTATIHSTVVAMDEVDSLHTKPPPLGSAVITLSPEPMIQLRQQIIQQALWVGTAALLLTLLLVLILSNRFTQVFSALRSAMKLIAAGDFSPPKQPLPSRGELGELSQDLHKMASALERNRKATLATYDQMALRAREAERIVSAQQSEQQESQDANS